MSRILRAADSVSLGRHLKTRLPNKLNGDIDVTGPEILVWERLIQAMDQLWEVLISQLPCESHKVGL